jgi:glycosidase
LGDEIATLNDYRYREDPAKVRDSRWVHRPFADWEKYKRRHDETTMEGKLYSRLRRLIQLRKEIMAFGGAQTEILTLRSKHLFSYVRQLQSERVLAICNFSEQPQIIDGNEIRLHGLGYHFVDLVSGQPYSTINDLMLEPYQFVWLKVNS